MSAVSIEIDSHIKVSGLPSELAKQVKQELTIANPAYTTAVKYGRRPQGISRFIRSYSERSGVLILPRGYWKQFKSLLQGWGASVTPKVSTTLFDKTHPPKEIELRDYQRPWVESLLQHNQGVGVAPPGAGKTAMALYVYSKLGQPCLWITHTKRLAHQAAKRAEDFLGIEAGLIGMGKADIKHFTIGLVPTLARCDLQKYRDKFGSIILDECQHQPAKSFTEVASNFTAHYRLGLTATPYRGDQLERLMFLVLGDQCAYLDKETLRAQGHLMTPTVLRKPTGFNFPYNPMSRKYNYAALQNAVSVDLGRNCSVIEDVIVESTNDERNVCIILVGRIKHGETLNHMIGGIIPRTGLVHSKMSTKDSDQVLDDFESGKLKILIATYKMLAEGFDYCPANRLFLTAPFKDRTLIEQACGRIERPHPGKKDAIVYDYVDLNVGVLRNQAEMRLDIYETNDNPVVTL